MNIVDFECTNSRTKFIDADGDNIIAESEFLVDSQVLVYKDTLRFEKNNKRFSKEEATAFYALFDESEIFIFE